MEDRNQGTRIVEERGPNGMTRWCDIPKPIRVPGRPELALFPDMLTWHCGNSLVERPYVRSVSYFPWILSLRRLPENGDFEMKYQSIHHPCCWISFRAAPDGSRWQADKYILEEHAGTTVAAPGDKFFLLLAQLPITEDERHFVRDWPAEEIAAARQPVPLAPSARREPPAEQDVPSMCLKVLELAQKGLGISPVAAGAMIIQFLKSVLEPIPPGSKLN